MFRPDAAAEVDGPAVTGEQATPDDQSEAVQQDEDEHTPAASSSHCHTGIHALRPTPLPCGQP